MAKKRNGPVSKSLTGPSHENARQINNGRRTDKHLHMDDASIRPEPPGRDENRLPCHKVKKQAN